MKALSATSNSRWLKLSAAASALAIAATLLTAAPAEAKTRHVEITNGPDNSSDECSKTAVKHLIGNFEGIYNFKVSKCFSLTRGKGPGKPVTKWYFTRSWDETVYPKSKGKR